MTRQHKILVVFGTRPEAIKLFPVIAALRADPRFHPVVCVSAQHRGMLDQVLEIAGIRPHHDLDVMRPDQTLDGLTANLLLGLGGVLAVGCSIGQGLSGLSTLAFASLPAAIGIAGGASITLRLQAAHTR